MSRPWQRAAPLLAASLLSCAGSPSARITERRLDGPRPAQAIIRCVIDGRLAPPVKIIWKLHPDVKQIGWDVPSLDETALLVQIPDRGPAWAECVAWGRDGVTVKAERALTPPAIASAPAKVKAGELVTVRGSGFGRVRGDGDGIYLVPPWGAARPLDSACKGAAWSDASVSGCLSPSLAASLPAGPLELRVQAADELARAPQPLVVTR
jgi:hypothetical protein